MAGLGNGLILVGEAQTSAQLKINVSGLEMCLGGKEKTLDKVIQFLQLVLCYGVTFSGA